MENTNNILEISHLEKSFGTHEVLKDIDFTVKKGDVISIIGASGSGKSTLLRCINLLENPTGGSILYHGEDITDPKMSVPAYREKVGMVFQNFNLFNNLTVLENCMIGPEKVAKKSKAEAEKLAMQFLEKVGMEQFINAKPRQLSGGQKQRAAVARALGPHVAEERCRVGALADDLYRRLISHPRIRASMGNPFQVDRLPGIVSVLIEGADSQELVLRLDAAGFAVSAGSACSSGSTAASHVLRAMGLTADEAAGSLRISFDDRRSRGLPMFSALCCRGIPAPWKGAEAHARQRARVPALRPFSRLGCRAVGPCGPIGRRPRGAGGGCRLRPRPNARPRRGGRGPGGERPPYAPSGLPEGARHL